MKNPIQTEIISSLQEMHQKRATYKTSQTIGFVPTMGYLHEGHLSLVRKAREENDIVIVSIFVNPTQFGPQEDLSRYPNDLPRDIELLKSLGVDIVFTPDSKTMYPKGFNTYVEPTGPLVTAAEGASRNGHFRGMATIVLKLFTITKPDNAYFGQKDAQQAAVVSRMISDFNLQVKLHIMPTIREKDGLAMSSRNAYLTQEERKSAAVLYKTLQTAQNVFQTTNQTSKILKAMNDVVSKEPKAAVDYVEIRSAESFERIDILEAPALLLIAAKIGKARLIDNFLLKKDNTWETGIIL
jgi:pantoate--beta-alanine ligase